MALSEDGRDEARAGADAPGEGGQGRRQAARRGSLDGPVMSIGTMELEARQGFVDAPLRLVAGTRALVVSSSPRR